MSLNDQHNRSVCGRFLASLEAALAAKARAVFSTSSDPAEKSVALAVLRAPAPYAAKFAPTIAADPTIDAVEPEVPRDDQGRDNGNGWAYPVPDATLVAALDSAWPLLVALEG